MLIFWSEHRGNAVKGSEGIFVTAQPEGCCTYSPEKGSTPYNVAVRPKI